MKLQVNHPCPLHGNTAYHVRTNTLLTTAFFEAFHEEIGHVGITKLSSLTVQEEIRKLTGRGVQGQDWPDFLQVDSALFRKNKKKSAMKSSYFESSLT